VLAIVPARSGSKGVPRKNVAELTPGRTLLHYVAEAATGTVRVDKTILSTDDEEIANVGRRAGLEVLFMRPPDLAADDTPMLPVLKHAIEQVTATGWTPEFVVLLQPTSPLRRGKHIDDALEILAGGFDRQGNGREIHDARLACIGFEDRRLVRRTLGGVVGFQHGGETG